MADRTGGQADYLYPNKDIPVPLPEDFYKAWLAEAPTTQQTQGWHCLPSFYLSIYFSFGMDFQKFINSGR